MASEIEYYQYAAKAVPSAEGGSIDIQRAGTVWRGPYDVVSAVRAFSLMPETQDAFSAWQTASSTRRPSVGDELGYQLVRPQPEVVVGPIASGDIVVAAEPLGSWLRENNRKLLAVEMEAAELLL